MSAPTEADLERIRDAAEAMQTSAATLSRATETNAGTGVTQTWANVWTGTVRLSVATHRPSTEIDLKAKNAVRSITFWIIRFPYGTDVRDKDRLTVGSEVYELTGVQAVRTMDTVVRCMATRLR